MKEIEYKFFSELTGFNNPSAQAIGNLENMVNQFPWFNAGHLLLAKYKANQNNLSQTDFLKSFTYTNEPLWWQYYVKQAAIAEEIELEEIASFDEQHSAIYSATINEPNNNKDSIDNLSGSAQVTNNTLTELVAFETDMPIEFTTPEVNFAKANEFEKAEATTDLQEAAQSDRTPKENKANEFIPLNISTAAELKPLEASNMALPKVSLAETDFSKTYEINKAFIEKQNAELAAKTEEDTETTPGELISTNSIRSQNDQNIIQETQEDKVQIISTKNDEQKQIIDKPPVEPTVTAPAPSSSNVNIALNTFTTKPEPNVQMEFSEIPMEPYHTIDYFAAVGIKLDEKLLANDKLTQQVKSFTDWLKQMKKVHPEKLVATNQPWVDVKKVETEEILTEAMAEVYMRQGLNDKAIELYEKLSLQNNEKKPYFAALIEKLKKEI
jgi:hypothetical protein